LPPGKRIGPITLNTDHFNRVPRLELTSVVDQTMPGPDLTEGEHGLRLHYKLDEDNNGPRLVASSTVSFHVELAPYPIEEAVATFVNELKGKDADVRRDAALAAGKLRLAGCRSALEEVLKEKDYTLRRYAAESLGLLGDPAAKEPLRSLLNDAEMDVRLSAAQSLVTLGEALDPAWVEPVIKSKHHVFQNAIWLVRRHAGKEAVPALIRCLDLNDPSVNSYYNYTLVWQIHACGGPDLKYHHDFDNKGTPEQVEDNRKVLSTLGKLLETTDKKDQKAEARRSNPNDPSEVLTAYIASKDDDDLKQLAVDLVHKAQVITLNYEHETPITVSEQDSTFPRSLKASFTMYTTKWKGDAPPSAGPPTQPGSPKGEIYRGVHMVFSRLFGDAKDMPPDEWLLQMKRPIAEGYQLKKVAVILTPSEALRKQTFERAKSVMKTAADRLNAARQDFSHLRTFGAAHHNLGQWDDEGWPRFPFLDYEHAVGPKRKDGRDKFADDWCDFYFVIVPISGNPRQRSNPMREFPRQAIAAEWSIETDDENFKKEFDKIVAESLKELDALETELQRKTDPAKRDG
jgi:hypothetical protein